MHDLLRYRALVILCFIGLCLYRLLLLGVGALLLSAVGLLISQQYWLALLIGLLAGGLYEGGYWLLVGRWMR
jgi:hypothetical protein